VSNYNYTSAIIAVLCFLAVGGAADAAQNVCDMRVLNRPGCEVGDFGDPSPSLRSLSPDVSDFGRPRGVPTGNGFTQDGKGSGDLRNSSIDLGGSQRINTLGRFGDPESSLSQQSKEFSQNDPDSSPELKVAWDTWRRRVAAAAFQRFATLAKAAFSRSRPLAAVAAYTVTRDGRILNARLTQPTVNPIYNAVCLTAINSLNGDLQVLKFPPGSRRMMVDQVSALIQNNGALTGAPIEDSVPELQRPVDKDQR
jgi:hypothetical protein